MAQQEINRKTHVQWIPALEIAIAVIDEISFIDPFEQYQQTTFKFNYLNPTTRSIHKIAFNASDTEPVSTDPLQAAVIIEVIDRAKVLDTQENSQDFWYTFGDPGNLRDPSNSPSTPPVHLKTHVTTIIGNLAQFPIDDSNGFAVPGIGAGLVVAVERIDEISFIDPMNQFRETIYRLDWEKELENDSNLTIPQDQYELLSTSTDPNDFIVRLDPFQNIIGVNQKRYLYHTDYFITGDQVLSYSSPPVNPFGSNFYAFGAFAPRSPGWYTDTTEPRAASKGDFHSFYIPASPQHYVGHGAGIIMNLGFPQWQNVPGPEYPRKATGNTTLAPTSRVTFNANYFLSHIYPDLTITVADRGKQYRRHIGDFRTTADPQVVFTGAADPDLRTVIAGFYNARATITAEYFLQWAVLKAD